MPKRVLDTLKLRKRAERSEADAELAGRIGAYHERRANAKRGQEEADAVFRPRAKAARQRQDSLQGVARAQRDSLEVARRKPKPKPSLRVQADASDTSRSRPRPKQRTAQGQINRALREERTMLRTRSGKDIDITNRPKAKPGVHLQVGGRKVRILDSDTQDVNINLTPRRRLTPKRKGATR